MLKRIGKWLPVANLFIMAGLILDVFCVHSLNLWWLWVSLSLGVGLVYGKYVSDKTRQETEDREEWEGEVESIRQTFTDLEQRSSRNPPCGTGGGVRFSRRHSTS